MGMSIDRIFIGKAVFNSDVWEESKHPRGKGGKFAPKGTASVGKSEKPPQQKAVSASGSSHNKPAHIAKPAPNIRVRAKEFVDTLQKAKDSCPPKKAWRVDTYRTPEDFENERIKTYRTKGGSTFAIKEDGDIISVCKNQDTDKDLNARDLMAAAVEAGGTHLDSFDGNYEFYTRCGFEPIARCAFDEEFAPDGWTKGRDAPEEIFFMKYVGVGNVKNMKLSDGIMNIPRSAGYDEAGAVLKKSLEGSK